MSDLIINLGEYVEAMAAERVVRIKPRPPKPVDERLADALERQAAAQERIADVLEAAQRGKPLAVAQWGRARPG